MLMGRWRRLLRLCWLEFDGDRVVGWVEMFSCRCIVVLDDGFVIHPLRLSLLQLFMPYVEPL